MSDLSNDQLDLLRSLDADLGFGDSDFDKKPSDIVLPSLDEDPLPEHYQQQQQYQQVHRVARNNPMHDVCLRSECDSF
jgi:hypothetical protein